MVVRLSGAFPGTVVKTYGNLAAGITPQHLAAGIILRILLLSTGFRFILNAMPFHQ